MGEKLADGLIEFVSRLKRAVLAAELFLTGHASTPRKACGQMLGMRRPRFLLLLDRFPFLTSSRIATLDEVT